MARHILKTPYPPNQGLKHAADVSYNVKELA